MRKILNANELQVGQQIAWTYPGSDADIGPLAGRVISVGEEIEGIRVQRPSVCYQDKYSAFFLGDDFSSPESVNVYVLEEAPSEPLPTISSVILANLDRGFDEPEEDMVLFGPDLDGDWWEDTKLGKTEGWVKPENIISFKVLWTDPR